MARAVGNYNRPIDPQAIMNALENVGQGVGNAVGSVGNTLGSIYRAVTTPIKPAFLAPIQQHAESTPIMPFIPQITPKTLMNARIPGADIQYPQAVSGGFPITQVPAAVQSGIRQMGRYAGMQPSALDIAMLPGYMNAMKGAAPQVDQRAQQAQEYNNLTPEQQDAYDTASTLVPSAKHSELIDYSKHIYPDQQGSFNPNQSIDFTSQDAQFKALSPDQKQAYQTLSNQFPYLTHDELMMKIPKLENFLQNQQGSFNPNAPVGGQDAAWATYNDFTKRASEARFNGDLDAAKAFQSKADEAWNAAHQGTGYSMVQNNVSYNQPTPAMQKELEDIVNAPVSDWQKQQMLLQRKNQLIDLPSEPGSLQNIKNYEQAIRNVVDKMNNHGSFNPNQPIGQQVPMETRPQHQVAIEQLLNAGDYEGARQVANAIPEGDPYKPAMTNLVDQYTQRGSANLNAPVAVPKNIQSLFDQMKTVPRDQAQLLENQLNNKGWRVNVDLVTGQGTLEPDPNFSYNLPKTNVPHNTQQMNALKNMQGAANLNAPIPKEAANLASVTPEEFSAYRAVQNSGITNMWDAKTVSELTGIPKDKILTIMKGYGALKDKFEGGGPQQGAVNMNEPIAPQVMEQYKQARAQGINQEGTIGKPVEDLHRAITRGEVNTPDEALARGIQTNVPPKSLIQTIESMKPQAGGKSDFDLVKEAENYAAGIGSDIDAASSSFAQSQAMMRQAILDHMTDLGVKNRALIDSTAKRLSTWVNGPETGTIGLEPGVGRAALGALGFGALPLVAPAAYKAGKAIGTGVQNVIGAAQRKLLK